MLAFIFASFNHIFKIVSSRLTDLKLLFMITLPKDLPSDDVVSLVVQFNIRIIDLKNKPKYLSTFMDHRIISFGKLVVFQDIV